MSKLIRHLRGNVVAYLALALASAGTSYAATSLPAGSVGSRQLRNHSIDPVKENPSYIGGNVRVWASVDANGKVIAGGRGVTITPQGSVKGDYLIFPSKHSKIALPRRCEALASVDDNAPVPGYANAEVDTFRGEASPWGAVVATYTADGVQTNLPFDFAVIC